MNEEERDELLIQIGRVVLEWGKRYVEEHPKQPVDVLNVEVGKLFLLLRDLTDLRT